MRTLHILPTLVLAVLIAGCASTPRGAATHEEATKVAEDIFRPASFTMSWIPSYGALPDAAFLAASARQPSSMAVELAQILSAGESKDTNVVVAGPSSAMSRRVLLDALATARHPLPHLKLLYIGSEGATADVKEALARAGATFVPPKLRR